MYSVLQVCLFDLDYGLPVQVRDTALGIEKEDIPESDVGKEFQLNEQIQRGQTESAFGGGGRPNDMLMQLARTTPYYKVCLWQVAPYLLPTSGACDIKQRPLCRDPLPVLVGFGLCNGTPQVTASHCMNHEPAAFWSRPACISATMSVCLLFLPVAAQPSPHLHILCQGAVQPWCRVSIQA